MRSVDLVDGTLQKFSGSVQLPLMLDIVDAWKKDNTTVSPQYTLVGISFHSGVHGSGNIDKLSQYFIYVNFEKR